MPITENDKTQYIALIKKETNLDAAVGYPAQIILALQDVILSRLIPDQIWKEYHVSLQIFINNVRNVYDNPDMYEQTAGDQLEFKKIVCDEIKLKQEFLRKFNDTDKSKQYYDEHNAQYEEQQLLNSAAAFSTPLPRRGAQEGQINSEVRDLAEKGLKELQKEFPSFELSLATICYISATEQELNEAEQELYEEEQTIEYTIETDEGPKLKLLPNDIGEVSKWLVGVKDVLLYRQTIQASMEV